MEPALAYHSWTKENQSRSTSSSTSTLTCNRSSTKISGSIKIFKSCSLGKKAHWKIHLYSSPKFCKRNRKEIRAVYLNIISKLKRTRGLHGLSKKSQNKVCPSTPKSPKSTSGKTTGRPNWRLSSKLGWMTPIFCWSLESRRLGSTKLRKWWKDCSLQPNPSARTTIDWTICR